MRDVFVSASSFFVHRFLPELDGDGPMREEGLLLEPSSQSGNSLTAV